MPSSATWVLLVDDHEDGRDLLAEFLSLQGLDVQGVASAEEALRCVGERGAPAIVITDLSLGEMSGADLARALKARETTRETPILAVTGHASYADPEKLFTAVLVKPVQLDTLSDAVRRLLPPR